MAGLGRLHRTKHGDRSTCRRPSWDKLTRLDSAAAASLAAAGVVRRCARRRSNVPASPTPASEFALLHHRRRASDTRMRPGRASPRSCANRYRRGRGLEGLLRCCRRQPDRCRYSGAMARREGGPRGRQGKRIRRQVPSRVLVVGTRGEYIRPYEDGIDILAWDCPLACPASSRSVPAARGLQQPLF